MSHVAFQPYVWRELRNAEFDGREEIYLLVGVHNPDLDGYLVAEALPATESWSSSRTSTRPDTEKIRAIADQLRTDQSLLGFAHCHPPNETTAPSRADIEGATNFAKNAGRDALEVIFSERQNERGDWEATEVAVYVVDAHGNVETVEKTERSEYGFQTVRTANSSAVIVGADPAGETTT